MENNLESQIAHLLRKDGLKLAVAESCTGGLLSSRITDVPGSSDYFLGGVVSYSNEAKNILLGVSRKMLREQGAVSRQVVLEMARGVRRDLEADIAVSVSGIAGPGGGLPKKPVGTTWIGLAASDGEWARNFCFHGDRQLNRASAVEAALQLLLDYLNRETELDADVCT